LIFKNSYFANLDCKNTHPVDFIFHRVFGL
jgi:hypothetical protein